MNYRSIGLAAGLCVVLITYNHGAVIFQDDFSNPAASYQNWLSFNEKFNTMDFSGNVCTVTNKDLINSSFAYHELSPKPEVFTLSCNISRAAATVETGLSVCFQKTDGRSYSLVLLNKGITILKPGDKKEVPVIPCPNLNATDNVVSISKSGTTFNVFVNNRFITTFTDSQLGSGDIALFSRPNSISEFDNIVLTNEFREGSKPTCYTDNFDSAELTYWNISSHKGTAQVNQGRLAVNTENDSSAHCFVLTDLELTNFIARIEVSHLAGSKTSMYGLRINGAGNNEYASFIINGNRMFAAGAGSNSITLAGNSKIRGAAINVNNQTYYFIDTLQIQKKKDTDFLIFTVNGVALDTVKNANFKVTNLGIYCRNDLTLAFDNFVATEGDTISDNTCPTTIVSPGRRMRTPYALVQNNSQGVYDILGRNVLFSLENQRFQKTNAVGVYIDRSVKGNVILK